MAKIIFDDMILLHTGSIIRGWHFVNELNTVFINIILACSVLLPYHPHVVPDEVGGMCSSVHLRSRGATEEKPVRDRVVTKSCTMLTGSF